jgi:fibronectin type 3 domain-containing protein
VVGVGAAVKWLGLVLLAIAGAAFAAAVGSGSPLSSLLTTSGTTTDVTTTTTTTAGSPPGAPVLVSATAGAGGVTLAWNRPADSGSSPVTIYYIYRGTASGQEKWLASVQNLTSYTDASTIKGFAYVYEVTALNAMGEGPRSNERAVAATGPVQPALFDPYQRYPSPTTLEAAAIGDVTGDGRADVVATSSYTGDSFNDFHLFVYAQNTDGTLAPPLSYATAGTYSTRAESVTVGDITGDGRKDVVVAIQGVGLQLFPQTETGTLGAPTAISATDSLRVRVGDFNGDAKPDLASIGWGTDTVSVFLNNSNGGLSPPVTYSAPHDGFDDLEVADVTNDKRDDIVVMSGQGLVPNVSVLPQLATGGFGPTSSYSIGGNALTSGIGVGDVNGDGRTDVVATDTFDHKLVVFPQTSLGPLGPPLFYPLNAGFGPVDVADFDGDRRQDVVTLPSSGWASILRQQGNGTLSAEEIYNAPLGGNHNPHGLAVGDVTGDGVPDVVAAGWGTGLIVLPNASPPPGAAAPGAPTLSVQAGKASATLTWAPPASNGGARITGYRIYRGTTSGGETLVGAAARTDTTFTDVELTAGTTYYYEVAAVNGVGEGGASNEASATPTAATIPDTPVLTEANEGYNEVFLDWNVPASNGGAAISSYRIYRGTAAGAETLYATVPGWSTLYPDENVVGGTTYYYKVSAVNAVGESALSNELSATPLPPEVPERPTLLTAAGDYSRVHLQWQANWDGGSRITGYKVYRGTVSGGETLLIKLGSTVNSLDDASGVNGTTYYYTVTALNSAGESVFSNELSATPLTPHVPDPPTLTSATGDYSKVRLAWQPGFSGGPAITGYKVYRGTASGGETLLATVGTSAFYTDTSGVNGTKYFYEVKAVNSVGDSAFSNELSATPIAPSPPTAPHLRQATAGYSSVTLNWDQPTSDGGAAISAYRVYRGTASGTETLLTTVGNVTTYTDTSGVNGTFYYYKVSALNSNGESALSNELSAVPVRRLFDPYQAYPVGSWPEAVAVGDVTGDGRNDIVLTTTYYFDPTNDYHVFVFAQRADGTLAAPVSYAAGGSPVSVAIGDITGDGRADVVVGLDGFGVQVFPQTSAGTLGAPTLAGYSDTRLIRLGQLNGDGRLDVASVGRSSVAVFYNDGQGALKPPSTYPVAAGDLETGDVTGDGRDDLVALGNNNVYVWPQLTGGLGPAAATYPTGANLWGAHGLGVGDVTGDGRSDVVVSYGGNWPNSFVAVLAQNQYLELDPPIAYATLDIPEPIDTGDFDLDGRTDVGLLHGGFNTAGVHRQQGNGTLFPEERYGIPYASHYSLHGVAVGDVTGDGTPDLVAASYLDGLVVLRNTTTPTNAPGTPVLTAAIADKTAINMTWTPPRAAGGSASGYRVYRGTASGGETLLATLGTATSFADNTAAPGKTYWYQVSAVNSRGESARSTERSATIPNPDAIAPTAPTSLKLVVAGTNQLALDWAPSSDNLGVTGYRVYRNNVLVATATTTQYLDAGLAAATNYSYNVRAIDAAGNASAASSNLTAKTASQSTSNKGTLAGAVFDAAGKPLANAVVTVGSKTAKTNASGAWQFTNLAPGTYSVGVGLTGYKSQTLSVAAVAGKTVLTAVTLTT